MSSKLTELTESSPSALPPSVLCGSGILSQLPLPWSMASSGHFDPAQTYDGYKAVEGLYPAHTKCLAKGKNCFQHYNPNPSKFHLFFVGKNPCHCTGPLASNTRGLLWSKKDGPFGKEFPVSEAPTPDVTCSRQRDVARWTNAGGPIPVCGRPIHSSSEVPTYRINPECSDELDGEEVEVVNNSIGHQSSTSPSHPPSKRFQSHIIPRTPRTFQPTLSTLPTSLPPASPSSFTTRPALIEEVRPSPFLSPEIPP
ncbi:hypothetical protein O181_079542 [Austropuccinia psidii MF-1]|uniref:Uncharacterized protein n=1 Tax=Austropuccinia psidii MF-1 TaxID=1389203 RepID=A0A9Q3FJW2_9BASI|nr:hypothetical protein [Austropuccinia psidii MF-1]